MVEIPLSRPHLVQGVQLTLIDLVVSLLPQILLSQSSV